MEFKIDTKPAYTLIMPVAATLDANMTAALSQKCEELTKSGSVNFIIDLQQCADADNTSFDDLVQMHENYYNNEQSLVFTGLQDAVAAQIKMRELDLVINLAPTTIEAIDIISMEILERDLFKDTEE